MNAWRTLFSLFLSLAAATVATAQSANEKPLKALWDSHLASPQAHAETKAACHEFARSFPGDPLLPVVQSILAWHLLQEGAITEAQDTLKPFLDAPGSDPVAAAAHRIACAWSTRILRERVIHALQLCYRKEVAYPADLSALSSHPGIPSADRPPLTDAFGAPWSYQLTGFPGLPGFENQRYRLQSATLGETSDLNAALKLPYASGIDLLPGRILEEVPPKLIVRLGTRPGLLIPGQEMGGFSLAFIGKELVVLASHSFWKVHQRP